MTRVLSISQIEAFDHAQPGGCQRKWWFERMHDLRPEQSTAQSEGDHGHEMLARYFKTGEAPKLRRPMKKAVTGAILKGEIPKPGPDMLVEERFTGQPKFDAAGNWIPLDVADTLHLAGTPLEGFVDLAFRRGDVPEIWDHKFFNPQKQLPDPYVYCKKGSELINTVQMPVYVLSQVPYWPDAKQWRIVHHYVSKQGVESFVRSATVHLDQVLERKEQIEGLIKQIHAVALIEDQGAVPGNRKACSAFNGCPHQSICSEFKKGKTAMDLNPDEAALFADIDAIDAAPAALPPAAPTPVAPAPAPAAPACGACGTALNADNGSKLQDGAWKHIGCPKDAVPAPEVKPRRRKLPIVDGDAPAAPAPVVSVPAPVAPVAPQPAPVAHADSPRQVIAYSEPVVNLPVTVTSPNTAAHLALADLFENIARLLRNT